MLISIVLALYNGEKFIMEQISSIFSQSRKVDEVFIIDDGSTDYGPQIVKDFIAVHHLKGWKYIKNEANKGWKENFWDGFSRCKGDLIFPCDQDDLWVEDKLEVMEKYFEKHNEIQVLASNYDVIYEAGAVQMARQFAEQCHDHSLMKVEFDQRFMYTLRPGCVYGFRKEFFNKIKNLWQPNDPHDEFLWRYGILSDGLYILHLPLIKFRRHGNNASSPYNKRDLRASIAGIHCSLDFIDRMEKYLKSKNEKRDYAKKLQMIRKFELLRLRFLDGGDSKAFVHILFRYSRFYLTNRSLLGDIYLFVRRSKEVNE